MTDKIKTDMVKRAILSGESQLKLAPGILLRFDKARERYVLLAPERIFAPDDIALEILQQLDGKTSILEISNILAKKYDAPLEEVQRDIIDILQKLIDQRIIMLEHDKKN